MVALWKHYAKSKSLATKDHLLHDSISMKCPKQANLQRKKVDWWLPGTRGRKKWEGTTSGIGVSFTGDEKILKYYVNILKPTKLCTLNGWIVWYVTYISIKLLLKKKYIWVSFKLPSLKYILWYIEFYLFLFVLFYYDCYNIIKIDGLKCIPLWFYSLEFAISFTGWKSRCHRATALL